MRKAKLIEQNALLFKQVEDLRREVSNLTEELKSTRNELNDVKADKEVRKDFLSPFEKIEERVTADTEGNADEYGAKAIGKIVIAATAVTSEFESIEGNASKERTNLVLGRAEVAKAEILKAVSENVTFKEKKIKIDSIVEKALDYIKNINAQRV